MQIDQAKIEAAIIEKAVEEIVGGNFADRVHSRVKQLVEARVDAIFTEEANARIKEAVDAAVRDGLHREYTAVDSFGRPVGAPTSIARRLEQIMADFWSTKVGSNGEPTSYGGTTRAEYVIGKVIAGDFKKTVDQVIVNTAGAFKDTFRDALHREINTFLNSILHVKSLGDQELAKSRKDSTVPYGSPEAKE